MVAQFVTLLLVTKHAGIAAHDDKTFCGGKMCNRSSSAVSESTSFVSVITFYVATFEEIEKKTSRQQNRSKMIQLLIYLLCVW